MKDLIEIICRVIIGYLCAAWAAWYTKNNIFNKFKKDGYYIHKGIKYCIFVASSKVIYVDNNILKSGDGKSWDTAFKTLEEAIDVVKGADKICIK